MRQFVLALGLVTTSGVNAAVEVTPYIVNGTDITVATEYPSFASLFYDSIDYSGYYGIGPFCGATLLSNQYVLTAAHCVYGDRELQLFMSVVPQLQNETDFPRSITERVMVNEYYYPDDYNNTTLFHDIAILKLASPLTGTYGFADLAVNTDEPSYRVTPSEVFYAVGHGNTQTNQDDSNVIQKTELSYVSNADCAIYTTDTSENLCMTGADTSVYDNAACQGDSGGPLYWQGKQVGITSFGPLTCGDPDITPNSIFTEVSRHENWIQSVLAGTELPKVVVNDQQRAEFLASGGAATLSITSTDDDSSSQSSSGGGGGSLGALSMLVLALLGFRRKLHS